MPEMPVYYCLRCYKKFQPRVKTRRGDRLPERCGACRSPYWDAPRKKAPAKLAAPRPSASAKLAVPAA